MTANNARRAEVRATATDYILGIAECADRANVHLRTFQRVIERGEGPPVVMISKWRQGILESDFTAWLRAAGSSSPRLAPRLGRLCALALVAGHVSNCQSEVFL